MQKKRRALSQGQIWVIITLAVIILWSWLSPKRPVATFWEAKNYLQDAIFFDHPHTLYCNAEYNDDKEVILPAGFNQEKYASRSKRMEWEHVLPAEHFGKQFEEWRRGHPDCENGGSRFYGRKCAALVNDQFRRMEADMYNIFPSIGSVNAARANRQYDELPEAGESFGSCAVKIKGRYFEPPDRAKGQVARAVLYMADKYEQCAISPKLRQTLVRWDRIFPVDEWECLRAKRIEKIQGNPNEYIRQPCEAAKLY